MLPGSDRPRQKTNDAKIGDVADPFLEEIASAKREADVDVDRATQTLERQLENRFSEDLGLKERLSRFAREHELDQALIAVWEEIKYYPSWVKREDFDKWNKLRLTDIEGSDEGEWNSVSFSHNGRRYSLSRKKWQGMAGTCADFSLKENGVEVFGISCSVDCDWLDIVTFKKHGQWAKLLLEMHRLIRIEENKSSTGLKYFRADEIKKRFEE